MYSQLEAIYSVDLSDDTTKAVIEKAAQELLITSPDIGLKVIGVPGEDVARAGIEEIEVALRRALRNYQHGTDLDASVEKPLDVMPDTYVSHATQTPPSWRGSLASLEVLKHFEEKSS